MRRDTARILIVDDDRENGLFLQEQLTNEIAKAIWILDPRQALQQVKKGCFQVGILLFLFDQLAFEFMLNALRLNEGFSAATLPISAIVLT